MVFPTSFWKESRFSIVKPFWLLFDKSLLSGAFPDIWKTSLIRPIHKNGDKEDIRNYRPLLNSIPKFFEKLVFCKLKTFIADIFIEEQHGFTAGRSTTTNLALFNNYLFKHLDRGIQVDVVHTDFPKAFDRVNQSILTEKLFDIGIYGAFFNWLKSYLSHVLTQS